MDTTSRFTAALTRVQATGATDLPDQLATAAARALAVDGVGSSLAAEQPALLGARGEWAAVAEQLQFTVGTGTGPCLVAVDTQFPLYGVESYLQQRWPLHHDLLRARTPYRSVVALPMNEGLSGVGAVVVYLESPAGPLDFDSFDAHTVVSLVSAELTASPTWATRHQPGVQHWIDTPGARVRAITWQAVTLLHQVLATPQADTLAVLRARAYSTGRLVDEIASDLVDGRLSVHDLA